MKNSDAKSSKCMHHTLGGMWLPHSDCIQVQVLTVQAICLSVRGYCSALLHNLMYRFMCRVSQTENDVIAVLANPIQSSVRFSSALWNHWRTCLYVKR